MPEIRCGSRAQAGLDTAGLKLLFDQNLAPRLVAELEHLFPGSQHVRAVGLSHADDLVVWEHAKRHGYTIVSKDADFHQMSLVHGAPPKVVWVRLGNCTTGDVVRLLSLRRQRLLEFDAQRAAAFLALR